MKEHKDAKAYVIKSDSEFRKRLFSQYQIGDINNPGGLAMKIPSIPRNLDPSELPQATMSDLANYNSHAKRVGLGAPKQHVDPVEYRIEDLFT